MLAKINKLISDKNITIIQHFDLISIKNNISKCSLEDLISYTKLVHTIEGELKNENN